jgi:hypothetical protein
MRYFALAVHMYVTATNPVHILSDELVKPTQSLGYPYPGNCACGLERLHGLLYSGNTMATNRNYLC